MRQDTTKTLSLSGPHVGLDDLSRLPHTRLASKIRDQARRLVSASSDAGGTPPVRRGPLLGGDHSRLERVQIRWRPSSPSTSIRVA
jgi:hypothetical protein